VNKAAVLKGVIMASKISMKKLMFAVLAASVCIMFKAQSVSAAPVFMPDGYVFDGEFYASKYPDIAYICGYDIPTMYQHYRTFGWLEGRMPYAPGSTFTVFTPEFDAAYYAAYNPDVVAAYGNAPAKLYEHYLWFGRLENRRTCGAGGVQIPAVTRWQYPQAAAVLDAVGWDMRKAYEWCVGLDYYGHGKPDMPENGAPGTRWFANYGFTYHKGNCFVFAATFFEMAKLLGYEPRQVDGQLPLRRGGFGPHSWDEIDIDGVTYVYDPECMWSVGIDAYHIYYGQKGTWRYVFGTYMSE